MNIQTIGGFFDLDEKGFLINPTSVHSIPSHWLPLVEMTVEEYLHQEGVKVHSVYLRGSVAKGTCVDGVSDLDTFALLHNFPHRWYSLEWEKSFSNQMKSKFSFVQKIECIGQSFERLDKAPKVQMIMATQALCIYGTDQIENIGTYKIDNTLILNLRWLSTDWEKLITTSLLTKSLVKDFLKVLIRSASELVMIEQQRYSTDLYFCCLAFAEQYPNHESQIWKALSNWLNPTLDKTKLINDYKGIVDFILKEWEAISCK